MSIELADILRKLALGQAGIIFLMIAWTIVRYTQKIRSTRVKEDKALPAHVALIAVSYLHFLVYVCISLYERFDEPATWRIPLVLSGCLFGSAALAFLMSHLSVRRYLRARIDREADKAVADASTRKTEAQERRMDRMEELGVNTADKLSEMHVDVKEGSHKADLAYHEANALNEKIEAGSALVNESLQHVLEEAAHAKTTAAEVSDKADAIGDVGADTNERVRKIEGGQ